MMRFEIGSMSVPFVNCSATVFDPYWSCWLEVTSTDLELGAVSITSISSILLSLKNNPTVWLNTARIETCLATWKRVMAGTQKCYVYVYSSCSLVPRPSHRPVFDRLQYAKIEGKAWSILSREWHCVYLGSWGGEESPSKNEFESFWPKCQVLDAHEVKNMLLLVHVRNVFGPLCLPRWTLTSFTWSNGPGLPPPFCILQAIKNWTVGSSVVLVNYNFN